MGALYKGFIVCTVLSAVALYFVTERVIGLEIAYTILGQSATGMDLYYCGLIGLVATGLIVWITEYYTGCLLYTSPSPRDLSTSRMPSSA